MMGDITIPHSIAPHSLTFWIFFNLGILGLLLIDLLYVQPRGKVTRLREAVIFTGIWIGLALAFNLAIYIAWGAEPALNFLAGYLLEKSLSIDNLFVFLVIFSYFKVPAESQRYVLFGGILAAIVFRLIFIFGGLALVEHFYWTFYVFGAFLIFTGIKMAIGHGTEVHPETNPILRLFRYFIPVSSHYEGTKFFINYKGKWMATPLIVTLIAIETADIVFAMDSIPAIFGITLDPFIVYSSNVFAILGLRSLFFVLSDAMRLFRYLPYGLSVILVFIGLKMLIADIYHIPIVYSLLFILLTIGTSLSASILIKNNQK